MTKTAATEAARKFIATYVRTNRQWNAASIAGCLPRGFDISEEFTGNPTVANIAAHIQAHAYAA